MESAQRPILALTMGDPVGVGPDIVVMALSDPETYRVCRPLIIGDGPALERARRHFAPELTLHQVAEPAAGRFSPGALDLLALSHLSDADLVYGAPTVASGQAMVSYILQAIELCQAGQAGGMVTGPISKLSMNISGYAYPGHTELLAERTGAAEVAMMLAGGDFRVVLATIHCPLAEVPRRLTIDGLFRLMKLTCEAMRHDLAMDEPRLGVAALNPHAGEGGMFGAEEAEIIMPAIRRAQEFGVAATGPFPADTLFWRHHQGEFDVIVCMYHDQGLIPLKLLHFMDGVNITLGLPIVRTSVDHGTAYELAGTGKAHPGSLKAAIHLAAKMAASRRR
jgi:4-hydroxythreonine-4-phosphate dehydrogenase